MGRRILPGLLLPIRRGRFPCFLQSPPPFLRIHPPALLGWRDLGGTSGLGAIVPGLQKLPESLESDGFISVLAPLFPAGGHEARWEVNQAYSALGAVLVLSPLSASGEGLDSTLAQEFLVRGRYRKGVRGRIVRFHGPKLSKSLQIRYGNGEASSIMFEGTQ